MVLYHNDDHNDRIRRYRGQDKLRKNIHNFPSLLGYPLLHCHPVKNPFIDKGTDDEQRAFNRVQRRHRDFVPNR